MTPISTDTLLEAHHWRYAVKKFDPARRIPADTWDALEQALVLSASSYGLQPWKFLVVNNPELREKLVPVSWNQRQVADASHFVVFTIKNKTTEADVDRLIAKTAAVRNIPAEELAFYKDMIMSDVVVGPRSAIADVWASRQVYLAFGNLLTSAALLGIDTCPMEGLDPVKYDEILGLTGSGYSTIAACPCGYRAADDLYATLAKVRYPRSEIIQHIS